MHLKPGAQGLEPLIWEIFNERTIYYALRGCIAYTKDIDKVTEMLTYVLLTSHILAHAVGMQERLFDVINIMTEVIGPDYIPESTGN